MTRKFVEDLLKGKVSDEELKPLVDSILDEHSTNIGKIKGELDTTKNDLKVANQTVENLKKDVSDRDNQLNTLKNSTEDVEGLKKKIETLQSDNASKDEEHAKEIAALNLDFAIDSALRDAKAKNLVAVKALINTEGLELLEDKTVKGLSDKIDELIKGEDTKFLFDTETKQKFKGAEPGETGKEDPDGKVDLSKMTYDERSAYLDEHPEIEV